MLRLFLLLVVVGSSQISVSKEVAGRVIGQMGQPLRGVTVLSMPTDETKTDEHGKFVIKAAELVRFSYPGYRPISKQTEALSQSPEVQLVPDPGGLWSPPQCSSSRGKAVIVGEWMQFSLPSTVRNRKAWDVDYGTNRVCRGKSCLLHGWGGNWSFGFPHRSLLEGVENVRERDVEFLPEKELGGVEYRGVKSDGTFMRFVGVFGETISYDHASKDAAQVFDAVIDSLCWRTKR